MKLHLGCSDDLKKGWLNVDQAIPPGVVLDQCGVFQVADLNEPWPWETSSVDQILAQDVFEHILDCQHIGAQICSICYGSYNSNPARRRGRTSGCNICGTMPCVCVLRAFYGQIHCLNEAWRVLKPGGMLDFKVPAFCLADGKSFNPGAVCDPTHRTFWHEDFRYYFCEEWNHPRGERGRLGPGMGITALFRPHTVRTIDYGEGREKRSKLVAVLEAIKP